MNADVRRKLAMVARVREFSRANPSDDPSHATLLGRLEDRLNRADALAIQERAGRIAERAAKLRRDELRRAMHFQLLRHLVRVGEVAAKQEPGLVGKFRLRSPNATHKDFLVSAKAMLADGVANKDLFVGLGLSAPMLDDLGKALTQFEGVTESGSGGRSDHIGARADLDAVTAEALDLVELLNTFNSYRFREDPELSAAWNSARSVIGPSRSKPVVPPAEAGGAPPAGAVAPAA
jgi:hypothetical protein